MTEDAEVKCLAVLLHLSSLLERWQEGPFRAGFETAIEEAAAYIEHLRAEDAQAMTREPKLTDSLSAMVRRNPAPDGSPSREPTGIYRIISGKDKP